MNPYASSLGNRDPFAVIASTPEQFQILLSKLGKEGAERPWAAGKWTVREVLVHLADAEIAFAFRIRQALAEKDHVIQPFDQTAWSQNYAAYDAAAALNVFTAVRGWNVALLRSLPNEAFAKKVTHPERGAMTVRTIVETMGGHDLNHLQQMEQVAA
jgi:uncharacterized damage-inducible protein DinB